VTDSAKGGNSRSNSLRMLSVCINVYILKLL
jgi:hypothetical protein